MPPVSMLPRVELLLRHLDKAEEPETEAEPIPDKRQNYEIYSGNNNQ